MIVIIKGRRIEIRNSIEDIKKAAEEEGFKQFKVYQDGVTVTPASIDFSKEAEIIPYDKPGLPLFFLNDDDTVIIIKKKSDKEYEDDNNYVKEYAEEEEVSPEGSEWVSPESEWIY